MTLTRRRRTTIGSIRRGESSGNLQQVECTWWPCRVADPSNEPTGLRT